MQYREQILQEHFCHWLDSQNVLYTASMVGIFLPIKYAIMRKRMGVKKGTPDIMIFESNNLHKGLFIELKSPDGNRKDKDQLYWQQELEKRGYLSFIMPKFDNFQVALDWLKNMVENYIDNKI